MRKFSVLLTSSLVALSAGAACNTSNIQASTPSSQLTLSGAVGERLVTDNKTGLMWMRCSLGQTSDSLGCSGFWGTYTWSAALTIAEQTSFAGYDDWRLPNIKELMSIVEVQCNNPSINNPIFSVTGTGGYWSSSTGQGAYGNRAWGVDFATGNDQRYEKTQSHYVRLVRGGQ